VRTKWGEKKQKEGDRRDEERDCKRQKEGKEETRQ
jgi:hypothetical protein